jgi:GNAT superfamily N-acetyltransferase
VPDPGGRSGKTPRHDPRPARGLPLSSSSRGGSERGAAPRSPRAPETVIRIEPIVDHFSVVETVIGWHWAEFGYEDPGGSAAEWQAELLATFQRDRVPLGYVALDGESPVGSAELIEHDLASRRDLSPWLAGVYVHPAYRHLGLGRRLVRTIEGVAGDLGFPRIYCFTETAAAFYEGMGWRWYAGDLLQGRAVTLLVRELAPSPGRSLAEGRAPPDRMQRRRAKTGRPA